VEPSALPHKFRPRSARDQAAGLRIAESSPPPISDASYPQWERRSAPEEFYEIPREDFPEAQARRFRWSSATASLNHVKCFRCRGGGGGGGHLTAKTFMSRRHAIRISAPSPLPASVIPPEPILRRSASFTDEVSGPRMWDLCLRYHQCLSASDSSRPHGSNASNENPATRSGVFFAQSDG